MSLQVYGEPLSRLFGRDDAESPHPEEPGTDHKNSRAEIARVDAGPRRTRTLGPRTSSFEAPPTHARVAANRFAKNKAGVAPQDEDRGRERLGISESGGT